MSCINVPMTPAMAHKEKPHFEWPKQSTELGVDGPIVAFNAVQTCVQQLRCLV